MARVIICRHGNTFDKGDLVRRVGARTDLALSKSGIKQANFLAEQFSPLKSGYNFSKAYCVSNSQLVPGNLNTATFILVDLYRIIFDNSVSKQRFTHFFYFSFSFSH